LSRGVPPSARRAAGRQAEDLAASWLVERGYRLLARNFSVRQGEVDLIVSDESVLAFVEVRSRADSRHGTPEATIGPSKIRRVVTAARHWLARNEPGDLDIRFDVVAVDHGEGEEPEIRHLPGAFEAGL
jgi:putative endonuclease